MTVPTFPQKCLAFHGPMLYEAKTLLIYDPDTKTAYTKPVAEATAAAIAAGDADAESKVDGYGEVPPDMPEELEDKVGYYIHYKGWKSTWDEWVSDERVLAWNEENLRTQKELKQMALAAANKKKSSSAAAADHADGSLKRRESGFKDDGHGRANKRGRGVELDLEKVSFCCAFSAQYRLSIRANKCACFL